MREIKFRALDRNGEWFYPTQVDLDTDFVSLFDHDPKTHAILHSYIGRAKGSCLSQHTGLKDKNGREIYEGDTVKFPDDHLGFAKSKKKMTGEVVWSETYCGWAISDNEWEHRLSQYPVETVIEVIGNIYENPEMKS